MDPKAGEYREIVLPASVFGVLRKELGSGTSPLAAIHALHAAGHTSGTDAAEAFLASAGVEVSRLSTDAFWKAVEGFLARRGWGSLRHVDRHEGVGFLVSGDWAEARHAPEDSEEAACSFSNGFLSGFLTRLANGPVAVLEVTCRGRGDESCTFAFGSGDAIHELYGQLLEGEDLDNALAAL
jgi:predicted hydrocarbon binding protein